MWNQSIGWLVLHHHVDGSNLWLVPFSDTFNDEKGIATVLTTLICGLNTVSISLGVRILSASPQLLHSRIRLKNPIKAITFVKKRWCNIIFIVLPIAVL